MQGGASGNFGSVYLSEGLININSLGSTDIFINQRNNKLALGNVSGVTYLLGNSVNIGGSSATGSISGVHINTNLNGEYVTIDITGGIYISGKVDMHLTGNIGGPYSIQTSGSAMLTGSYNAIGCSPTIGNIYISGSAISISGSNIELFGSNINMYGIPPQSSFTSGSVLLTVNGSVNYISLSDLKTALNNV